MRSDMNRKDRTEKAEKRARVWKWLGSLLENIFVVALAFYPLRHIDWGLDLWDTGYNYANFQYMGTEHMDPMWLFSTYLSNVVGNLITRLSNAKTLWAMNLYTGLFVSLLALTGFFFCYKALKMPAWIAFIGEFLAVSLCWCPTALLYNYLTYVLLLFCVILLYRGLTGEKKWCLFAAGVCLGANVLARFSNLPEAALILAVWAYDLILWREDSKRKAKEREKLYFCLRLGRHTLWCLMGYLSALLLLFTYIQIRYGLDQYAAGIARLLSMTETATDYKAKAMIMGMLGIYIENIYWAARIGAIVLGGMILLTLSGWLKGAFDRFLLRFDDSRARNFRFGVRIFMGALGFAIAGWLYYLGFWTQFLQGGITIRQLWTLLPLLAMLVAFVYFAGGYLSGALLGLVMLGWLYYRGFCSLFFYSYDPILRPGVLFLMLTILIAAVRIVHPKCSGEEKLIGGLTLLVVFITSIGSNNGIYPSLNNLFVAAPYTLWQSWRFLRNAGAELRIGKLRLSTLPVKGALMAFLLMCLFQFGLFGVNFVFAEATGVQNAQSFVENNEVLKNIRMSADKALWMTQLSDYVDTNGLQGREVILYGSIPSLSYYLQMPSAFNPWSDLDSYSKEQMALELAETADEMDRGGSRPVVIVEREYVVWLSGGSDALKELGVGERRISEIEQDQKWLLLLEFMEEQDYERDFDNGKFTVYR